jgi:opacity protein-like surface antigen
MNKKTLIAVAAMAAAVLPAWADEAEGVQPPAEEKADTSLLELSVRVGLIGERKSMFKNGGSLQLEARAALGETPLDIVLRGYYGKCKVDKDADETVLGGSAVRYNGYDIYDIVNVEDGDNTLMGGSAQLQFNFARGEKVNPYIAAGAAYEKSKYDLDIAEYILGYRGGNYVGGWQEGTGNIKSDADGTAFVGRIGVEFDLSPFCLVLEGSYLSKFSDDYWDESQFEISGRAGFQWTRSCRIDVGIDYYTEWEQAFAGVGLTLCL